MWIQFYFMYLLQLNPAKLLISTLFTAFTLSSHHVHHRKNQPTEPPIQNLRRNKCLLSSGRRDLQDSTKSQRPGLGH